MSSRIVIGNKEVTNPAARAAIGIVVVPLALTFALAVVVGTITFVGIVLGLVGALLIALAILIPVIVILAVIAKVVSLPFTHFDERDED